jgi:hypothetical protein
MPTLATHIFRDPDVADSGRILDHVCFIKHGPTKADEGLARTAIIISTYAKNQLRKVSKRRIEKRGVEQPGSSSGS